MAYVHQTFMDLTHVATCAQVANKQLSMDVQLIGGFNPSDSSGFCTEPSLSVLSLLPTVLPLVDT